jgi:hypothetical protein
MYRIFNTGVKFCTPLITPRYLIIYPLVKGNNMLSALAKYVINIKIHGLFHIALVMSPRLISSLVADIKSNMKKAMY